MTNKPWPAEGRIARFDEIIDPLRNAVDQLYVLNRRPEKDIEWEGFTLGDKELGACLEPDYALSVEMLRYDEESQGRDPMRVLLGIAVQLGIEQGRRLFIEDSQPSVRLCEILLDHAGAELKQATKTVKDMLLPRFGPEEKQ